MTERWLIYRKNRPLLCRTFATREKARAHKKTFRNQAHLRVSKADIQVREI